MIPTPHSVGWREHLPGAVDAHNNPVDEWAAPVAHPVHAVVDAWAALPDPTRGKDLAFVVYAPQGFPAKVGDLLTIDGADHEVARVIDYGHGPWPNPDAGVEVHLTRTEG